MSKAKQIILCLVCVFGTATATSCDDPFEHAKNTCPATNTQEIISPDGKLKVQTFEESCKPHLDVVVSTRAILQNADLDQTKVNQGNFSDFINDDLFEITGKHVIRATWLDSSHLLIECPGARPKEIKTKKLEWESRSEDRRIIISYKF